MTGDSMAHYRLAKLHFICLLRKADRINLENTQRSEKQHTDKAGLLPPALFVCYLRIEKMLRKNDPLPLPVYDKSGFVESKKTLFR